MREHKLSFVGTLDYRIAASRFESAFEAWERLPHDDRLSLLREFAGRIVQEMPRERPAPNVIDMEMRRP
jgi:hypothetical protein